MAATARLGEWEVLTWIQQYFDDRTEQLEALEYYQVWGGSVMGRARGIVMRRKVAGTELGIVLPQERRLKSLGLLDDQGKTTYDWMD